MVLLAQRSRQSIAGIAALHRMDEWLIALEFIVLVALVFSLGGAVRALLNVWGLLLVFGVVILGMVLPLALSRRRDWLGERTMSAAALLVLAGEFILRTVIVFSPDAVTS
jgi:formate-dependent nitrite reductase membrane component NrfD